MCSKYHVAFLYSTHITFSQSVLLAWMWYIHAEVVTQPLNRKSVNVSPVKLRLEIDLVSYPARAEGLVNRLAVIVNWKARCEQRNNISCCFKQILKATTYKIAIKWKLASYLTDSSNETNKTWRAPLGNLLASFSYRLLYIKANVLVDL